MRQHLSLLREFVRRDFESRYAGSILGFLWSLLQPAFQLALYTFAFGYIMKIPLENELTSSFGIFLFCALMPWLAVHEGIQRGTTAITDNASLVKKVRFPAEILVATSVLAAVLHQAIASVVFLAVLPFLGDLDLSGLPLLLLAVPLQVLLTAGIGFLAAAINIYFRDVSQLQGMVLIAWFYLTPIVYPLSLVPEKVHGMILLNPMTALVDLYRQAFLGGRLANVQGLWPLALFALVLFVVGLGVFRHLKPSFADEL